MEPEKRMRGQNDLVGIRIYNGVSQNVNPSGAPIFLHGSLAPGRLDFSVLFQPIIESGPVWAFRNSADLWRIPYEWFDEFESDAAPPGSNLFEISNSGFIVRDPPDGLEPEGYLVDGRRIRNYDFAGVFEGKFMQKYGAYVRNDWNELVTLNPGLTDYSAALKYFSESTGHNPDRDSDFIKKNVDRYFHNFDGLFWWFFTRDAGELESLKEYLGDLESVNVEAEPSFDIRKIKMQYWE